MHIWWRLIRTFFRMGILNEAAYRANFFLQIFQSALNLAIAFVLLQTVFSYTSTLNGWHQSDLIVLMGIYFLMGGCINLTLLPSMNRFIKDVRQGTLDYTLLKPVDTQILVSIQQVEIWKLVDIVLGVVLIILATIWSNIQIGLWESLSFVVTLLAGCVIMYAFLFFLSILAFWYIKMETILVIFQSTYEAGRWPVTIYPGWLRLILTFVIPVAFAITIPTQALMGQLSWYVMAGSIIFALLLLIGTRIFWNMGVKHYAGASS